jgi:hypothetical protein
LTLLLWGQNFLNSILILTIFSALEKIEIFLLYSVNSTIFFWINRQTFKTTKLIGGKKETLISIGKNILKFVDKYLKTDHSKFAMSLERTEEEEQCKLQSAVTYIHPHTIKACCSLDAF